MAKWLNIGIGADNEQLKKDMQSAAAVVGDGSTKMAGGAVAGGAKMEQAQAKTAATLRTLQQQFRQADKDAQLLAQTQGMGSAAFIEAARTAGDYRDQLMDVREVSAAFASGTPVLQSTLGMVKGLAGGFATAQSAAALFGAESQDLQETLMKVQAAMALMQGLQSLEALSSAYVAFSAVLKTQVLPALLTVNGALMAAGIGVAIAAYIAINQAVTNYNSSIEREIALEKTAIENKKELAAAVNTATDNILRSRDLEVRAMQDGIEKSKQELEQKKLNEIAKEKAIFASSNRTYIDQNRLNQNIKNIEQFYYNERVKLLQDFEDKRRKAAEGAANAPARKPQTFNQIPQMAQSSPALNPIDYKPALIAQENFQNQSRASAVAWANDMATFNLQATAAIEQGLENTISSMASALGQSLAEGGSFAEAGAAVLLNAVGSMAVQLGQLAIGTGIAMTAIKKAFTNPFTAIAAGVALVAIGSFVSSQARAITSGGGGGGGSIPGMSEGGAPQFQDYNFNPSGSVLNVGGIVRGGDMVIAINNTERNNRRTR